MADLYHIYIFPKQGVTKANIEARMNLARDWFRYNERCYVVKTTTDEKEWGERLLPLVDPGGYLFICRFDPAHYHGFMSSKFWEWFQPKANGKEED
jgi:hypothetical protein